VLRLDALRPHTPHWTVSATASEANWISIAGVVQHDDDYETRLSGASLECHGAPTRQVLSNDSGQVHHEDRLPSDATS
jgi:hypothetical protein